ncbi:MULTISPECIES: flagellar hook-length control protein FliK [unclassified Microbacterium]|uniref:flagellar hook-length control protein FliK n=1 Tax=unclassified Microbacterium TaxID=2609290 RepID=UPI00109C684C|nr:MULTISPECIES: flagellar hook-length control protein FliK [unclassified Microbacterium]
MTALGIVDMLDARASRPTGGSPSRGTTPGAAAFADVIQDAARAQRADDAPADGIPAEGSSTGSATTEAPTEPDGQVLPVVPAPLAPLPSGSGTAAPVEGSTTDATLDLDLDPMQPPVDAAEDAGAVDAAAASADLPPIAASSTVAASVDPARATASAGALAASAAPPAVPGASPRTSSSPGVGAASLPVSTAAVAGASDMNSTTADVPADAALRLARVPSSAAAAAAAGEHGAVAAAPAPASASNAGPALRVATATAPDTAPDTVASPAGSAPVVAAPAASVPATADAAGPTAAVTAPAPASPSPIAPSTPVAAAAIARPVLLPQISAPVVALAQAADGDHSLTLTVSPENLGPVTVRAHISGGAIHIELHAPNDLGREALRTVLADLRRDLAAAAPHASLMLSSSDDGPGSANPQSSPNGGSANGNAANGNAASAGGGQTRGDAPADRNASARPSTGAVPSAPDGTPPVPLVSPHGGIDVFA